MEYQHGGDIYSQKVDMDYSANLSPLGLPAGVKRALLASIEEQSVCSVYPDSSCSQLRQALGAFHQIPQDWIVCGNGAADLIFALTTACRPMHGLVEAPTFSEYSQALKAVGSQVDLFFLKEEQGFQMNLEEFSNAIREAVRKGTSYDMVFLCNPNNPTGIPIDGKEVRTLAEVCHAFGTLLVVDECFCDFLEEKERCSVVSALEDFPNLIILKAFTKIYAMAGLRLGYALCSDQSLLERLSGVRQPWSVSGLAQSAGLAALHEVEYVKETKRLVSKERIWLAGQLKEMGFLVYPSQANYLFFRDMRPLKPCPKGRLYRDLLSRGILIRSCENYPGLDNTYYRICVKTREENRRFITILREVLQEENRRNIWQNRS